MAMVQPTVVYQSFAAWSIGRQQTAVTYLGSVSNVSGGTAVVFFDQTANQFCIDNLS